MKRTVALISVMILCFGLFAGCNKQTETKDVTDITENAEMVKSDESSEIAENNEITEISEITEKSVKVINPLPETLDINNLENCNVSVSLEKGDAYVDDSGKMMMKVKVYSFELYDMVDIAQMAEDDVIVRLGEEIKITSLVRLESGLIRINGGEENGGFELATSDETIYYEIGMNDARTYYELGEVTLPVSVDFVYSDKSDPDVGVTEYYPGDFLVEDSGLEYNFNCNNTSIVTENGVIIAMIKKYTP